MRETAMKDEEYQARPIACTEAPLAYPLVYLHDPSVTLDAWLDFVRRRTSGDGTGLIAFRDRADIIHALFAYRVDFDIQGQRQLCIAQLIVAQIPGSQIDRSLVACIDRLKAQLGCRSIAIEQPLQVPLPPTAVPAA
jgi:hypothetical protein